jgi:sodium-dependent dicarboxylate transporter 2/3/5
MTGMPPSADSTITHKQIGLVFLSLLLLLAIPRFLHLPESAISHEGTSPSAIAWGLGILACIALLWLTEALPLAATSLLVPLLVSLSGICDIKTALLPFADPLIFMFIGGFALASALSRQRLDIWLAQKLILLGKGRFLPVCFLLFACTAFLSMWMNNTATTAMMLPIALGLLRRINTGQSSRNHLFLLLGIAYSAGLGGLATIIGSPPNGIAAAALHLNFAEWMSIGLPCTLLLLPCMALILYFVCKPDREITLSVDTQPVHFDRPQVITLIVFALTALCWMCGHWLSRWLGITHAIDTIIALSCVFCLLLLRAVSWAEVEQGIDWNILLLFGGGLALSDMLQRSGGSFFLANLLSSCIATAPLVWILITVVAFAMFSAAFTSNTGCAALLVPIFFSVSGELGLTARSLVIPLALACSCSFMLPISTPPNAIIYSTGLVPQRAMMKNGFFLSIICLCLIVLIAYFYLSS